MRIEALLRERAAEIEGLRKVIDAVDAEKRGFTAEERQEIEKREETIASLDERIGAEERTAKYEASLRDEGEKPELRGQETQAPEKRGLGEADGEEYREAMLAYIRSGMVDPEQAKILRAGYVAEEARDMTVGVNANGGYVVAPGFEKTLLARAEEFSVMRQVVGSAMQTGQGNTITLPKEGARGAAAWIDESAAFTESDDAFGQASIEAWKAGRLVKASLELLDDSFFDIETYLATSLGESIGVLESAAYVSGDGTKKPKGFLLDAQVGVTAAANNAITGDEVIDLIFSVRPYYRQRSKFVVSDSAVKLLRKLKDSNGRYIWDNTGAGDLKAGVAATILGYPVYTEVNMPTVASTSKPIAFGDFGQYLIRDVRGVRLARLGERYLADEGKIGFLGWHRTDGELLDPTAVKTLEMAV